MHTGKRLALAAAAALTLGAATQQASAALVYDIRLTDGGGKAVTTTVGSTVGVSVYAIVTGANATADEGYQNSLYSLVSNNALTGGTLGVNVTSSTNVAPFNTAGNQLGLIQDFDGDGDLDVGKDSGQGGNGNFVLPRAASTVSGSEFLLTTFNLLVTAGGGLADATINVALPGSGGSGTTGVSPPAQYVADGTPQNQLATLSVGAPVVISVPEPATMGVLGLAGLGLLARRRRA